MVIYSTEALENHSLWCFNGINQVEQFSNIQIRDETQEKVSQPRAGW